MRTIQELVDEVATASPVSLLRSQKIAIAIAIAKGILASALSKDPEMLVMDEARWIIACEGKEIT